MTTNTPMRTVADFKRAATPGSRWQCTNNLHPHVSGLRVVTGGKTVLSYTGTKADGSTFTNGHLEFPKANAARFDGDSVHFLYGPDDDRVAYTWTRLHDDQSTPDVITVVAEIPQPADGHTRYTLSNGWFIDREERTHRRHVHDHKYSAWAPGEASSGGARHIDSARSLRGLLARLNAARTTQATATPAPAAPARASAPEPSAPVIAHRATTHEARRHFEAGGRVLVSEYGSKSTQTVGPTTVTHDRTRTTWDELAATVREWRGRYPNQRFYIVPAVPVEPAAVTFDPAAVRIERHRASVTQGEVSVSYAGELVGRFGDDVRLCTDSNHAHGGAVCFGGFHGRDDRYWIDAAAAWMAERNPAPASTPVTSLADLVAQHGTN